MVMRERHGAGIMNNAGLVGAMLLAVSASALAYGKPCIPGVKHAVLSAGPYIRRKQPPVTMQDLRDGMDSERNKQVSALKKLFYSSDAQTAQENIAPNAEKSEQLQKWTSLFGVLEDVPLCRWQMVMLPGFNQVLNVFQPMYTHMFEAIVAKEQPWYYVHLQTPGGTDNLMNPDFDLRVGTQAPLIGVLMRIVSARRMEDSRLTVLVQGLTRVRILKQTQREPYARATVQVLPDAELTASHYARATTELMGIPQEQQTVPKSVAEGVLDTECQQWIHTVAHAAAVASEMMWLNFEFLPEIPSRGLGAVQQLCNFNPQAGLELEIAAAVGDRQREAMRQACDLARNFYDVVGAQNASVFGVPVLSPTDLSLMGILGGRQSGASLPTWEAWEEWISQEGLHWDGWGEWKGESGDEGSGSNFGTVSASRSTDPFWVAALEEKLWIEIDALVRNFRRIDERLPLPPQLLALLPRAPVNGWPQEFVLHLMADFMLDGETPLAARVGEDYDPLRRAQRLSYAAWCLLGLDPKTGEDLSTPLAPEAQAILETSRTQERIALLLHLITDINKRLPKGY